jgi:hypothetical protein
VISPTLAGMATFSPHSPQGSKGEEGGDLSSASSTSDPENEYVVDRIIAQIVPDGNGEGEEMYLVRWEGYPDERCTVSQGPPFSCPFVVGLLLSHYSFRFL